MGLSYRIVELFSEGLYQSANKAFEELVTNSFDAGALHVQVMLPPDLQAVGATIAVFDDGSGMNSMGLERLWQIGVSQKIEAGTGPRGRLPIGKFGIGKLATYTLCRRLTYVCKQDGGYVSTTMDFGALDATAGRTITTERVELQVRSLTEEEATEALLPWTTSAQFQAWERPLFGEASADSWTVAILSDLKEKAAEIKRGMLGWILSTALPLRDDFAIVLDGEQLTSSKLKKPQFGRWTLGNDLEPLKKPVPSELEARPDRDLPEEDVDHFGVYSPALGRVTGFAELYKDPLTGKSDAVGRSYGFFVYVRDRLINIQDPYFGVDSNLLKHGAFGRSRVVIHADKLNESLQSNREAVRDSNVLDETRHLLHAIFNFLRGKYEEMVAGEPEEDRLARHLVGRDGLIQRPIADLARKVLHEGVRSRTLVLPATKTSTEAEELLEAVRTRVRESDQFITEIDYSFALAPSQAIAVLELPAGILRLNGLHPFVGSFSDDFRESERNLPLQLFAIAEVALEATLHQQGLTATEVTEAMEHRDAGLRELARTHAPRTAQVIAQALEDAASDRVQLEIELVWAMRALGFDAERISGPNEPDGVAFARLAAEKEGVQRAFKVSLEAKSKEDSSSKVKAKTVGVANVTRHRDNRQCDHALVVAPDFEVGESLHQQLDREAEKYDTDDPGRRSITTMRIRDLARLVRHSAARGVVPEEIRGMLFSCALPDEAAKWVTDRLAREPAVRPFREIIEEIYAEQSQDPLAPVSLGSVKTRLWGRTPPVELTPSQLLNYCRAIEQIRPDVLRVLGKELDLRMNPEKAIKALHAGLTALR